MIRNYTHVTKEHLAKQMDAMPSILDAHPTPAAQNVVVEAKVGAMSDDDLRNLAAKVAAEMAVRKQS